MKTEKVLTLSNNTTIPAIGLGTAKVADLNTIIPNAINLGYRLIDTAVNYNNEIALGNILKDYKRNELFITSKIRISTNGYEETQKEIERSLRNLKTNYIDLMLIHQPYGDIYGEWRALEDLYERGYLHAIGVSNFGADRLMDLCVHSKIKPMVNQVELHPHCQQKKLIEFCNNEGIIVQGCSPFGQGKITFEDDDILSMIALSHGKTVRQIILIWLMQKGVIPLPRTNSVEHLFQNIDVFDCILTDDEMNEIGKLDKGDVFFQDHRDPQIAKLLSVLVNNYDDGSKLNIDEDYFRYAFGKRYKEIALSGTCNTRFLSKYNSRINDKIIRSDNLDKIDETDIEMLESIGVSDIIDLRKETPICKELTNHFKITKIDLNYHSFSDIARANPNWERDIENILVDEYLYTLSQYDNLEIIFKTIIAAPGKVIICCRNGKDRTGVICALLHLLTKASVEAIIDDYILSVDKLKANKNVKDNWFYSPMPNVMKKVLEEFNKRYLSMDHYLLTIGLNETEINNLLKQISVD